jgi:hypothetical protein
VHAAPLHPLVAHFVRNALEFLYLLSSFEIGSSSELDKKCMESSASRVKCAKLRVGKNVP